MSDELRDEYSFDYQEAKPNRFAAKRTTPRPYGLAKGDFVVPDDFDDPLPEDILRDFEG
jgi:hypothetical protein